MKYLTAKEVAEIRRKTEQALAMERRRGEGPPWDPRRRPGPLPKADLEAYLAERTVTGTPAGIRHGRRSHAGQPRTYDCTSRGSMVPRGWVGACW